MKSVLVLLSFLLLVANGPGRAADSPIPSDTRQLIVGVAPDWDSSHVTLYHFEQKDRIVPLLRRAKNPVWRQVGSPWKGRLGRNGMAWGIGLHRVPEGARWKREGDGRSPAGVFLLGGAWGYDRDVARNYRLPYRQITPRCLWYEDIHSPYYNSYRQISHEPRTTEEKKAQMHQGDYAHSLKLFIAHNADREARPGKGKPGYGSAIFFHIWRENGARPTAGCTTMSEDRLRELIRQIDPAKNPCFILLPRAEYDRLVTAWGLPVL